MDLHLKLFDDREVHRLVRIGFGARQFSGVGCAR